MNRKAYNIEKQVASVQCQASMWLIAFRFHVLCLGKPKSVLTGFSNSHVLLMGNIITHKSQTQSGPLIYLKTGFSTWRLCCQHNQSMQRGIPVGPLATLYPADPEKFKFCLKGEFGKPWM